MTETSPRGRAADARAEVLAAAQALSRPEAPGGRGVTSDLSIDEVLLLHSIAWEPVDLVFGSALASVPSGVWNWGQGEIGPASDAHRMAFASAVARLASECAHVGGHGVVGVHVEAEVERLHIDVELVGTAVRPLRGSKPGAAFSSDLSARDFVLLSQAGWAPVGLAFGSSFTYVPRRSVGTTIRQKTQNVELTNFTEAMYSARESAMARLQDSALGMGAQGLVAMQVGEGPMPFAHHAIGFTAWGTAVRLVADEHRLMAPRVVLPLDDAVVQFEAASLRSVGPSGAQR